MRIVALSMNLNHKNTIKDIVSLQFKAFVRIQGVTIVEGIVTVKGSEGEKGLKACAGAQPHMRVKCKRDSKIGKEVLKEVLALLNVFPVYSSLHQYPIQLRESEIPYGSCK